LTKVYFILNRKNNQVLKLGKKLAFQQKINTKNIYVKQELSPEIKVRYVMVQIYLDFIN